MPGVPGPDIYPLDCIVLGNTSSITASDGSDKDRRALHFWGYARDRKDIAADNTKLCFVDHYEPTSSSSHGATDTPIFCKDKLQYLGLRFNDVGDIMAYFQEHFEMRPMASENTAFTTSGGDYRMVKTRWPDSDWYFLFPLDKEGIANAVVRKNLWHNWAPEASPY
jgi:hypothetical protein